MALSEGDELLSDCRSGWLTVESDFSTRLAKPEQLKYALQCMGRNPSDKAVERYWGQCGGSMSFEQFCVVMRREKRTTMGDLMRAFRKIDTNGDGYITAEELHRMLTKRGEKMSHDEVQAIIDEADYNGDGKLDYAEFCHMLITTAEDCTRANKLRASKILEKRSRQTGLTGNRTAQTDHTSQTGLASREQRKHKSGRSQRKDVFERREKRREEIRAQLFSTEQQMRKESSLFTERYPKAPEGGPRRGSAASGEAGLETGTHVQSENVPEEADSSAVEEKGSTQPLGLAPKGSVEPQQPLTEAITGMEVSEKPKHEPATSLPPLPAPTATELSAHENQPPLNSDQTNAPATDVSKPKQPPAQPAEMSEHRDMPVAPLKTLGDPFDIPTSESLSKLPPLKRPLQAVLPPISEKVTAREQSAETKHEDKEQDHKETARALATVTHEETERVPVQDAGEEQTVTISVDIPAAEQETPQEEASRTPEEASGGGGPETEHSQEEATVYESPEDTQKSTTGPGAKIATTTTSGESESQAPAQVPESSREGGGGEPQAPAQVPESSGEGGGGEPRQTDHLARSEEPAAAARKKAPTSVVTPVPKKPKDLESWNSITGKGCFYLDVEEQEESATRCHHYRLNLPSPTHVWIGVGVAWPGNLATDILLFLFHTNKSEEPTKLITYTQHRVEQRWVCRLDLDAGSYALVPFTSGCHLKPREEGEGGEAVTLVAHEGGKTVLTEKCRAALEEIFHRIDLDSNEAISRTEFDFFQDRTSGEVCDDDAWRVIQENFEMTPDDELTLGGFLALHVMTAEDEDGGEGEIWDILSSLGYNRQLQLDQACPFELEVFTEDCEGEIEIIDLLPYSPVTGPALSLVVMERGVCGEVDNGRGELHTYTFSTPDLTTIVVENKGSKKVSVQLDCSRSVNAIVSQESSVHVLDVEAQSSVIGFHLMPEDHTKPYSVHCIASRILC